MFKAISDWAHRQYGRSTASYVAAIRANPQDIRSWTALIERMAAEKRLSAHASALAEAHDIKANGHAVHAFAQQIVERAGRRLSQLSEDPENNIEHVIEELVKWTTAIQCGHSHDVSKGYFHDAEPFMDLQWNDIIYPLIQDLDFSVVLDLACGHGRNSEFLRKLTKELHLVDINQSCIDACRERFGDKKDGTRFFYHVTDGNHLRMIPTDGVSLVYCWDSMVHFDKLIVRDYLTDIARVLRSGGSAFLHHSNYGSVSPDSSWATNPGTRSDMSADLMKAYATDVGLTVGSQHIQGRKEGWGMDGLDCVSILRKA
jgi:SAM-dependent methyltransferase